MAVKPNECNGISSQAVCKIDAVEARIDERLRAAHKKGRATECPTGHVLDGVEKKLLAARYAGDWTVTFDYSRATGETIAVFRERKSTNENKQTADQ